MCRRLLSGIIGQRPGRAIRRITLLCVALAPPSSHPSTTVKPLPPQSNVFEIAGSRHSRGAEYMRRRGWCWPRQDERRRRLKHLGEKLFCPDKKTVRRSFEQYTRRKSAAQSYRQTENTRGSRHSKEPNKNPPGIKQMST